MSWLYLIINKPQSMPVGEKAAARGDGGSRTWRGTGPEGRSPRDRSGDSTRLATADVDVEKTGSLYTCLFAVKGQDLRKRLREGASDRELSALIGSIWSRRADRYSEIRSERTVALPKIEMSYIGG